jgi:hypothetical protein
MIRNEVVKSFTNLFCANLALHRYSDGVFWSKHSVSPYFVVIIVKAGGYGLVQKIAFGYDVDPEAITEPFLYMLVCDVLQKKKCVFIRITEVGECKTADLDRTDCLIEDLHPFDLGKLA